MARFAVILPAAGKSSRFGQQEKKVFATLASKPVWLRSAELFVNRLDVSQTLVVIAPEDREMFQRRYGAHVALLGVDVVAGGAERFESVANALAQVRSDVDYVAVHDAARPCLLPELVDTVFSAAIKTGAAMLAVPVADTIKKADSQGKVEATIPRQGLWLAQTPQVFRRDWLVDAYANRSKVSEAITDDAQLIEALGHPVYLINGSSTNVKITTREDLALAETFLAARAKPQAPRPIHPFEDEAQW